MKTIKLHPKDWTPILQKIEQEYGRAIALISFAMKRELGFQVRHHRFWQKDDGTAGAYDGHGDYVIEIHLDFDNEAAATHFRLKYL